MFSTCHLMKLRGDSLLLGEVGIASSSTTLPKSNHQTIYNRLRPTQEACTENCIEGRRSEKVKTKQSLALHYPCHHQQPRPGLVRGFRRGLHPEVSRRHHRHQDRRKRSWGGRDRKEEFTTKKWRSPLLPPSTTPGT